MGGHVRLKVEMDNNSANSTEQYKWNVVSNDCRNTTKGDRKLRCKNRRQHLEPDRRPAEQEQMQGSFKLARTYVECPNQSACSKHRFVSDSDHKSEVTRAYADVKEEV